MTLIIKSEFVLEDRDTQTLVDNQIFDSNFPMYVDTDNKIYQMIPVGKTMQRREVDPDSLNDIDGIKFLGAAEDFDEIDEITPSGNVLTITADNITNLNTTGFKNNHNYSAATSDRTITYPDRDIDLANVPILVKISLTSVQILDLNSTPIEAVAAPGSGKIIQVVDVTARLNFNSVAYATNTVLDLINTGATDPQAFTANTNSVLAATVTKHTFIALKTSTIGVGDTQILEDTALNIQVPNGDPTAGDSTVDIWISYIIKTL